ncbi:hypothetical protein, partial [Mesorhizobium sp. M7A.T.Ca.US.000.02.2.1]|uniref:hypothetical protein n=1 Tax=Mesorhizobium sp. M7A.T.Ca.US.000.02.2.1 TaxID=2496793 RepID=UPI001AECE6DF
VIILSWLSAVEGQSLGLGSESLHPKAGVITWRSLARASRFPATVIGHSSGSWKVRQLWRGG